MKNIYLKAATWIFSAALIFAACNPLDIYVIGKNNPTVRTLEVSGDSMDENSAELTGSVRWEQSASDHSFDCEFAVSESPDFPAEGTETFSTWRRHISQDDTATHYYNVTADGLEAGTTYYYVFSITDGVVEVSGEVRSFTTPGQGSGNESGGQTEDYYEIEVSNELNEAFSIAIEMQSDWWIENTAKWFSVAPLSGEAGLCEIVVNVNEVNTGNDGRSAEFVIYDGDRLIYVTVIQPAGGTGETNGHEWVDLGLSVRWATCNVGASVPSEYGDYYAWGEIETKTEYTEENSVTSGVELGDISGNPQYDAATANWGEGWRMPTEQELQELVDRCVWEWTSQGDSYGYKVTGPNGNSIYLPAAGNRFESSFYDVGESGYYWSSTPYESGTQYADGLRFDSGCCYVEWGDRCIGSSVRPVSDK
ncbi:MAG TPA: hypothetical protein IAC34_03185 [Candidatus Coprenecus stercoripullorum]|nr:hypothetical protein [Candidatus Coprenecus stercoripullorum]